MAKGGKSKMTLFNDALELHKKRQYKFALKKYLAITKQEPNHYDALNNIGCVLDDMGKRKKALLYLKKAISLDPNYFKAYYNAGYIYRVMEKYNISIRYYTKTIELSPGNSDAYSGRGLCYLLSGKYNKALSDYKMSIMLMFHEYNHDELIILIKPDQYDEAIIFLEKLITGGFLTVVKGNFRKSIIIMADSSDRIVLRPEEIHVGKTNKRHLNKIGNRYELRFDADFIPVMDRLDFHYREKNKYLVELLYNFYPLINKYAKSIRFISVSLYLDGKLVAGDLGILAEKTYISLTGFHDAPSAGSVQLILLACELVKRGIVFWDLGPTDDQWNTYKIRLGAKKISNEEYLKLFHSINPGSENIIKKLRNYETLWKGQGALLIPMRV